MPPLICPQCQAPKGQWDECCAKCGCDFAAADRAAAAQEAIRREGCPACGAPRSAGAESCAACGIFYAKFHASKQKKEAVKAAESAKAAETAALGWKQADRKRSGYLMLVLTIAMIGNPIVALFAWANLSSSADPLAEMITIALAVFATASAFGVYLWKKVAVYCFLAFCGFNALASMMLDPAPGAWISRLIMPALLAGAVFKDWELYE